MRRVIITCSLILVSYLGLVIYANRALFFSRFDETYWKERYEQSQWKLPLSLRTIGDDGLYLYEGYRLIHGGDPTAANAEMPPLGKYLIGLSIVLLGNGHLYGLITTVSLLIFTYLLARLLMPSTVHALMATTLLATDPLITNQYTLTMMDALQATLLMMFLYLTIRTGDTKKQHRPFYALAAGVLLGLFSATKLPVLAPILIAASAWYLFVITRSISLITIAGIGGLVGYLVPYTGYFIHGHTFTDWLKIQKWIIGFYRNANLSPTWGSDIVTLLAGRYQNIFSRQWEVAHEWSPSWTVLFIAALAAAIFWFRTKARDPGWGFIISVLVTGMLLYAVIPFWVRYLVAILPLLYLAGGLIIAKLSPRISGITFGVLLMVNIAASWPILFSSPQGTINQFIYNTEHFLFADLYEDTTRQFRNNLSRDAFTRFSHRTMQDGEIEFINIEQLGSPTTSRQSPQYIPMTFTYFTRRLGTFSATVTLPILREDNRWRIPWEWSVLVPHLTDTARLETYVDPARRGSIIASDKKPLARDDEGVLVWVTPGRVDKTKEPELLTLLERVFNGKLIKVAIHQRIVGNSLPDVPVAIGAIPRPATDPEVRKLLSYSGVLFTAAPVRITYPSDIVDVGTVQNSMYAECCSFLYSSTVYDGASGIEKRKNEILKGTNGGALVLKDAGGTIIKTFITAEKIHGKDVEP